MRKLVAGAFVTLDGVMQAPGGPDEDREGGFPHGGWLVPFFDEEFGAAMSAWTIRAGGFLLGRKTYEIFAASWPKSTDPADEAGAALNSRPKYVASRTLERVEWQNSTLLEGDLGEAIRSLKEEDGKDLPVMEHRARVGNRLLAALPTADLDLLVRHFRLVELERDAAAAQAGRGLRRIAGHNRPDSVSFTSGVVRRVQPQTRLALLRVGSVARQAVLAVDLEVVRQLAAVRHLEGDRPLRDPPEGKPDRRTR